MSKSLATTWIKRAAEAIFRKLMSISDDLMWRYIELLSFEPMESVDKWKKEVSHGRTARRQGTLPRGDRDALHDARGRRAAVADF